MEGKTQFWFESIEEREHESLGTMYRHATIKVYIGKEMPKKFTDEIFRMTYQEHIDKDTQKWSGYYSECIEGLKPNAAQLKEVSALFEKMQKYNDSLSKRGLRVDAPYNDDFRIRVCLLKGVKVIRIRRDGETGETYLAGEC